jgi:putative copper export protein
MKKLGLTSITFLPLLASAHAGHGTIDQGFGHYITSPLHLLGLTAIAVFAFVVYKIRSKKNRHA